MPEPSPQPVVVVVDVEVAAAAHEGRELALPEGVAARVAVLPQAVAADLRMRLVAVAFGVHAREACRCLGLPLGLARLRQRHQRVPRDDVDQDIPVLVGVGHAPAVVLAPALASMAILTAIVPLDGHHLVAVRRKTQLPAVARRRSAAHVLVEVARAPADPRAPIRRAAWRGAEVVGRLDVASASAAVGAVAVGVGTRRSVGALDVAVEVKHFGG